MRFITVILKQNWNPNFKSEILSTFNFFDYITSNSWPKESGGGGEMLSTYNYITKNSRKRGLISSICWKLNCWKAYERLVFFDDPNTQINMARFGHGSPEPLNFKIVWGYFQGLVFFYMFCSTLKSHRPLGKP